MLHHLDAESSSVPVPVAPPPVTESDTPIAPIPPRSHELARQREALERDVHEGAERNRAAELARFGSV